MTTEILCTGFHAETGNKDSVQARLALGLKLPGASRVHVMGLYKGRNFLGDFWIELDRDNPKLGFTWLDNGRAMDDQDATAVFYALFTILDSQEEGMLQQQERRIAVE